MVYLEGVWKCYSKGKSPFSKTPSGMLFLFGVLKTITTKPKRSASS